MNSHCHNCEDTAKHNVALEEENAALKAKLRNTEASLYDKVKCCATCGYPGDNHFEYCKEATNE
jgi:hypothetical protein